jgi:predicted RNA-binding protein with TRAM domain
VKYNMEGRRRGGFGGGSPSPPINVGDEVDVHIEAVGEKGDGLAKVRGFVLFVPGAKEGEDCRVKITRVLRKVGFADKVGAAQPKEESQETEGEEQSEQPAEEADYEDTEDFGEEQESGEESPAEESSETEEEKQ